MTQALLTRERGDLNLSKLPRELLERRPIIPALQEVPERLLSFGNKPDAGAWCSFFIDDYRFQRCWSQPERYVEYLRSFAGTLAPDFSLYVDHPVEVQRWNCFRNRWLAAFWNANGIPTIPTISWADESSFEWCFEQWPTGGTVAVSTIGTQKRLEDKVRFIAGYREMLTRLQPSTVVVYGTETDLPGPVVWYAPFYSKFEE